MAQMKNPERDSRLGQKNLKPVPAAAVAPPPNVAPLFRRIDWLTLLLTFGVVWVVYFLTLAPELTLEDSGELVTGSLYAGIPHPPGYPVWTIYSWLWTVLVPWGNPAWRVALAEAFLGALACGLLSLMVSRGSSMFIESIEEFKGMTGKWENAICMVSGWVAGLLLGLDGFMWKESVAVNRIAVSSVPWFLIVLLCMLRWFYAPHQYRYLYWGLFVFGICFTTHQSLIVAGLGVQVAIAAANPRLGRDVFFFDFILYLIYYLIPPLTGHQVFSNIQEKPGLFFLFNVIGVGSLLTSIWLAIRTKGLLSEWLPVVILGLLWLLGVSFYLYMPISGMTNPPMQWGYPRTVEGFWHALSRGQYEQPNPTNLVTEPGRFVSQLGMLVSGAADEFTWVYLFMALVPFVFYRKMQKRERAWIIALSAIYFCLGVLLVILLNPTPDRATSDLVKVFFCNSHTIVAALIGYGLALTATFMATRYASFRLWGLIGGGVAAVLGVICLWTATGRLFFGPAGDISLSELPHYIGVAFAKNQLGLPVFGNLVLVIVPVAFVIALLVYQHRGPVFITLGLFAAMPLSSGLAHYFGSNQHNHMFGYWFGHDMFTPPFKGADNKPIYPEMTKDAVLYGGTDPGRFCPTYMVFCESFTPHDCQPKEDQKFDRRDVYIITQNALADGTYLNYIRAHYNRSKEIDPPFFQELFRSDKEKEQGYQTNFLAGVFSSLDTLFEDHGDRVEKRRRTYTSWFTGKDFIDLPAFAAKLRPTPNQDPLAKFIYDNLAPETRQVLQSTGNLEDLRERLSQDLNLLLDRDLATRKRLNLLQQEKAELDQKVTDGSTSESLHRKQDELAKEIAKVSQVNPLYDPERFKHVQISEYLQDFIQQNPQSHTRVRLNRLLLEAAYPKEIAKSLGGVYPDREIYIATPDDSQHCFNEYLGEAQRRLQHDMQFPNEPKQIRPGEDVRVVENRVTVAGQVAVMAINGLLTKVMFDHNPKNEFFVEESFPLEWMYPHLTPYGVIMKINRQPLPSLSEDVLRRDHLFWKQYSNRLTGDFIDYDTSIKQICDWIEKTYLRHNFNGFTGDRKFIHDDDAQKAFSKLRSSIGGIYAWRLSPQSPPQYRPKSDAEFQQVLREAEFTFRQAFAFCPYSPEALFRYVNLLLPLNRVDDALLLAQTCLKLDPYNTQVIGLVGNLQGIKTQMSSMQAVQPRNDLQAMEDEVRKNPNNSQAAVQLAGIYVQMQQTGRAAQLLDSVLSNSAAPPNAVVRAAQIYNQLGDFPKLERALEKLTQVSPESPEAWYDLAAMKANLGKNAEAVPALTRALELNNQRLQRDPKARDLSTDARQEPRFASLRTTPEFQKLLPPK
jgi:tetratricopeptide (TPR) repeat protein